MLKFLEFIMVIVIVVAAFVGVQIWCRYDVSIFAQHTENLCCPGSTGHTLQAREQNCYNCRYWA